MSDESPNSPTAGPPRPQTADVVVVGGGPAGAAAATELARSGHEVVVVDKAMFPRDKCCGDGLTTLALRQLEALGFAPGAGVDIGPPLDGWFAVDGAWLRSPGGREVEVPLPSTGAYAAVCPRRELDAAVLALARAAGALVRTGATVTDVHQHDDRVDVEIVEAGGTNDAEISTITARYVVAADGMWSPVRKSLGLAIPGYRGEWHAFRQYASNVTGPAGRRLIVWFEPDLLPGYAWSFPLPGGRANVGFGVLRDGERRVQDMAALWRDLLGRPHVVEALGEEFLLEGRHTAWPIPARIDDVPLSHGRTLFVGDAAAATDVMTGEGIGQALLTGRLAARAIGRGGALQPTFVRDEYESLVRAELFADHRMARRLGRVLAHRRGAEAALGVVAGSGDWGRRRFARWMFEDEPRAIAVTPSRWHRGMLARPGAWAS